MIPKYNSGKRKWNINTINFRFNGEKLRGKTAEQIEWNCSDVVEAHTTLDE